MELDGVVTNGSDGDVSSDVKPDTVLEVKPDTVLEVKPDTVLDVETSGSRNSPLPDSSENRFGRQASFTSFRAPSSSADASSQGSAFREVNLSENKPRSPRRITIPGKTSNITDESVPTSRTSEEPTNSSVIPGSNTSLAEMPRNSENSAPEPSDRVSIIKKPVLNNVSCPTLPPRTSSKMVNIPKIMNDYANKLNRDADSQSRGGFGATSKTQRDVNDTNDKMVETRLPSVSSEVEIANGATVPEADKKGGEVPNVSERRNSSVSKPVTPVKGSGDLTGSSNQEDQKRESKSSVNMTTQQSISSSKASLNHLLESFGDGANASEPVPLAQFPLSLSKLSITGRAESTDGKTRGTTEGDGVGISFRSLIPCRDRRQERINTDFLSAVFYSKPVEELQKLLDKGAEIHTKCRDSGASVLHVASLNADTGSVEFLIKKGADVTARDRGGKQAVHVAAWEGALEVLKVLCNVDPTMVSSKVALEDPFIIEYQDSWNHKHDQINKYWHVMEVISESSTPLHVACRRTKESCAKFLIDAGAETMAEDSKGLYPVDVIGIDVGEDPINREASDSSEGSTVGIARLLIGRQNKATSQAATGVGEKKEYARVRRLMSIEDHDERPVTALHTAVRENNLSLITMLLDEGEDVLVWNEGGVTPLHLAVRRKFLDALCLMLRHGDNPERRVVDAIDRKNRTLLHLAVGEEWTDGVSVLLEENADITRTNDRRETVLHIAAAGGNFKILTELLTVTNVWKIVNLADDESYVPIHKAVERNSLKSMELLIKSGAKVDVLLPDGRTLLHMVAKSSAIDLLEYLMNSTQISLLKENKTIAREGGMTALHVASCLGHAEIVQQLLRFGCDLGEVTNDSTGSTCLHLAAKFDRPNVIRAMLDYDKIGSTLEARDNHGWYPLHIAAGHGHEECVDILLRAGADIARTVQDEQGSEFTGLDIIMTCVHRPVDFLVKILDSYIIVDTKVPVTNPQCKIEVDFDLLLPSPPEQKQLGVLEAVLNNGSDDLEEAIFLHPITQTFLYLKSKNMYFFFALFFDLFFLLACYLSVIAYHGPFTLQQPVYRYILIGLLSVNMLFEIINVVRLQRYYLKDPETWIKLSVYCNILVIVIHPTDLVLRYNMAVSILLSWTELLLIIAKYPAWGIYVLMFATVAGTILKVLVVFSLLLVGFAFTFRALFQEKGPFNSVWSSFVKVIIMVYELDYRGTMEETKDEGEMFADIARLFYLMFVLMVSVSLVNLMLGLAVSDIAELKRKGRAKKLAKQVAFLGGLENLLYSWPLGSLPLFRRYRQVPQDLVVKAGSKLGGGGDSPVPKKLKEAIIDKARSVQQTCSQRAADSAVVRSVSDDRSKADTSSIATRKSLSASRNRVYLDRCT